ncbi:hypothetical protein G4V62_16665 [Bacillaceae bacterium SIJ1]|uniref:aromatic acid exporter family protein n=1 Tax=Litoribacterium kuwaitense TaxID=1398745 RepID=UPI0013E9A414|nr:aromatic acid exporter family protein [Litoribacterium kuwaitense]NGP46498.1 hypothetical protein [Litoribacterium kuwaitense]
MKPKKWYQFAGGRLLKTGLAVLLTALICDWIGWPPMFAVITAIVTIEPTASDSIQKALVRFPASVLGAGYAMICGFIFHEHPLAYALTAMATIYTCYKLKLYSGTLVATLTGVAMVSTVHDDYLFSFFIRMGTTGIGLIVSSLVNVFVMPPDYGVPIWQQLINIRKRASLLLRMKAGEETENGPHQMKETFQQMLRDIEKTDTFCAYQKKEWKFHRFRRGQVRDFHYEQKLLELLRQFSYHLGHMIYLADQMDDENDTMSLERKMMKALADELDDKPLGNEAQQLQIIQELATHFKEQTRGMNVADGYGPGEVFFSPQTSYAYELLSMVDLMEEIQYIERRWRRTRPKKHAKVYETGTLKE